MSLSGRRRSTDVNKYTTGVKTYGHARTVAAMVPSQLKPTALTESPWLSSSRTGGSPVLKFIEGGSWGGGGG